MTIWNPNLHKLFFDALTVVVIVSIEPQVRGPFYNFAFSFPHKYYPQKVPRSPQKKFSYIFNCLTSITLCSHKRLYGPVPYSRACSRWIWNRTRTRHNDPNCKTNLITRMEHAVKFIQTLIKFAAAGYLYA